MEEGARAVVVFNYASIGKNELKLRQAEVVRVEQVLSPDWILCTADNGLQSGLAPATYLRPLIGEDMIVVRPHEPRATSELRLIPNMKVTVIHRYDNGYAMAESAGVVGVCPVSALENIEESRAPQHPPFGQDVRQTPMRPPPPSQAAVARALTPQRPPPPSQATMNKLMAHSQALSVNSPAPARPPPPRSAFTPVRGSPVAATPPQMLPRDDEPSLQTLDQGFDPVQTEESSSIANLSTLGGLLNDPPDRPRPKPPLSGEVESPEEVEYFGRNDGEKHKSRKKKLASLLKRKSRNPATTKAPEMPEDKSSHSFEFNKPEESSRTESTQRYPSPDLAAPCDELDSSEVERRRLAREEQKERDEARNRRREAALESQREKRRSKKDVWRSIAQEKKEAKQLKEFAIRQASIDELDCESRTDQPSVAFVKPLDEVDDDELDGEDVFDVDSDVSPSRSEEEGYLPQLTIPSSVAPPPPSYSPPKPSSDMQDHFSVSQGHPIGAHLELPLPPADCVNGPFGSDTHEDDEDVFVL